MNVLTVGALIGMVFLGGCATTNKEQTAQIQQLQSRVASLEEEVASKDDEISKLQSDLQDKSMRMSMDLEEETTTSPATKMSVRQIQSALKSAGFYTGSIDGKMGPKTKAALKSFQRAHGLKVDGVAGRKTLAELSQYL